MWDDEVEGCERMKIGVLQCDSVRSQFQRQHGDYPAMIDALFRQVSSTVTFKTYDVTEGCYPGDVGECDAYITTGSKASVYDATAWIAPLQAFIIKLRREEKKLLAICFGHQLVAQAFGGKVTKSNKGWGVGVHTIQVALTKPKPWMEPPLATCNVLVSHQDQVEKLPVGATLVATSDFCPYAMFQLDDTILTIQGHPEFTRPYASDLMGFRRELLGEPLYKVGIESLQNITDEQVIARWMLAFIAPAFIDPAQSAIVAS